MMKNELRPGMKSDDRPKKRRFCRKNWGFCSPGHRLSSELSRPNRWGE